MWNFTPPTDAPPGRRFVDFRGKLRELRRHYPDIGLVAYENVVKGHTSTRAAHVYGGLLATLLAWCIDTFVHTRYLAVNVKVLKKWSTGNGNASKVMMVQAARRSTGLDITDDNEADAVLLALWAAEQVGRFDPRSVECR
jgi:Holliday junction resolvasome RuvABC endonuclease subunit